MQKTPKYTQIPKNPQNLPQTYYKSIIQHKTTQKIYYTNPNTSKPKNQISRNCQNTEIPERPLNTHKHKNTSPITNPLHITKTRNSILHQSQTPHKLQTLNSHPNTKTSKHPKRQNST